MTLEITSQRLHTVLVVTVSFRCPIEQMGQYKRINPIRMHKFSTSALWHCPANSPVGPHVYAMRPSCGLMHEHGTVADNPIVMII